MKKGLIYTKEKAGSLSDVLNTDQLKTGQIVKNYKELCLLLNEEIKSGKTKVYQLKRWLRYFGFERKGHSYIITDIFDKPKLKKSKKFENSLYLKHAEKILIIELSGAIDNIGTYSKVDLCNLFGMTGKGNIFNKSACIEIVRSYSGANLNGNGEETIAVSDWEIDFFRKRVNNKLREILFSILDSMVARDILTFNEKRVIAIKKEKKYIYSDATEEQIDLIIQTENNVMINMGLTRLTFANMESFYNEVNTVLQNLYGWHHTFKSFELTLNKTHAVTITEESRFELEKDYYENQRALNTNIIAFMNEQAIRLYNKNQDKYKRHEHSRCGFKVKSDSSDGKIKREKEIVLYHPDFVKNQRWLAEMLLQLD